MTFRTGGGPWRVRDRSCGPDMVFSGGDVIETWNEQIEIGSYDEI